MAAAAVPVRSLRGAFAVFVLLELLQFRAARSATFTVANNCGYTVWPGLLSSAGSAPLLTTGFALAPGESRAVAAPAGWSGRLWGRTLCSSDAGRFACGTGDCGSGDVQCGGGGAAPPATLAEFTLDGSGGLDFFDVSLVDGYNLPMLVTPLISSTTMSGKCAAELNGACPADLRVDSSSSSATEGGGVAVACKSACGAYGRPEDCCSGDHATPQTCQPSASSRFFKAACPRAYSYAYDDATSTFTCAAGATDYAVTFCPAAPTSVKSTGPNPQAAGLPQSQMNDTMVFVGRGGINAPQQQTSGAASLAVAAVNFLVAVAAVAL